MSDTAGVDVEEGGDDYEDSPFWTQWRLDLAWTLFVNVAPLMISVLYHAYLSRSWLMRGALIRTLVFACNWWGYKRIYRSGYWLHGLQFRMYHFTCALYLVFTYFFHTWLWLDEHKPPRSRPLPRMLWMALLSGTFLICSLGFTIYKWSVIYRASGYYLVPFMLMVGFMQGRVFGLLQDYWPFRRKMKRE